MSASSNVFNQTFLDNIEAGNVKMAQAGADEFVRMKMREDGFTRRILEPQQITNDMLDRQVDTDKPVMVLDKEPDSPAAITVPFGTVPENTYIYGPRYRVMFDRIMTPRFTKDIDELRTYDMDIRQIMSDNSVKDMTAEEDAKFIAAVNTILSNGTGLANQTSSITGAVQWRTISGGITRDSLVEALKVMNDTSAHLEPAIALCNHKTAKEVLKFTRNEAGGDLSQDMILNGFAERDFLTTKWVVTIKRDLVPDNTIFYFADPKFLGKFFVLEDSTMFIEKKAFMLEWFAYELIGGAIANAAACARVDFS
jgi:hypothetical protein